MNDGKRLAARRSAAQKSRYRKEQIARYIEQHKMLAGSKYHRLVENFPDFSTITW